MIVSTNTGRFQMSIERLNRDLPYVTGNLVLVINELNIGGVQNLTREIVQSWRGANIPGDHNIEELTARWAKELKDLQEKRVEDRTCITCQKSMPVKNFTSSVEGSFLQDCSKCREIKHREHYTEKECSVCNTIQPIGMFKQCGKICRGCRRTAQQEYRAKKRQKIAV